MVAKARAEELRVAESEPWKGPSSAMPSSSAQSSPARNEEVQPDSTEQHAAPNVEPTGDSEMLDSLGMRIPTKRPDHGNLEKEVPKRLRIVTKHSRPLWMATDTVSEQQEKRARPPETHAEADIETFALTLESRGTPERYTELNVAVSDLHEPDPEEMWSDDLGWVPKSALQAAREKEVTKLQEFGTFEEVPQDESEGEIISSRFVDKWDTSGELRSRLVSRGYEASQIDPASLFAATPSVTAARIALVLGLAQDVDMAVADISGAFLHAVVEQPFYVEYRTPGIVWKVNRHLYGDKRGPRGWQDHFQTTMLDLNFERVLREEGSNAQGLDHCGGACG